MFPPALPEDGAEPMVGPISPSVERPRKSRASQEAYAPGPRLSPRQRLEALSLGERLGSWLEVELPGDATEEARRQAKRLGEVWNAGDHDAALALWEAVEDGGLAPSIGFAPPPPPPPAYLQGRGADVRLGGSQTGCQRYTLDYHAGNGNIFAVIGWDTSWTLNISTNDGATWSESFAWSGSDLLDLDLVVVGDWVYVLYVDGGYADELRLRRCHASDGTVDADYGFKVIYDASPNGVTDVAIASNADDANSNVYCFARVGNNTIRYLWASSSGETFYDASPSLANAAGGIDAHWNDNFDTYFLFLSYTGTDENVHIWRRSSGTGWEECYSASFSGYNLRTALSVYDETVFCAFEHLYSEDYGIRSYINYTAGDGSWYYNTVAEPLPGEAWYALADTSCRGGGGIALVYQQQVVDGYDPIYFRNRHTYGYSPWNEQIVINDHDATPDTWTAINWLPPLLGGNNPYGYGMIYEADGDMPFFDRQDGYEAGTGDNCGDPILIQLPSSLPYTDTNTTCGRVDDYNDTCMGSYDGGEDIIYELNVTAPVIVDISVDADTIWAGVGVFSSCPDVGPDSCIATATSSDNPDLIENLALEIGTYYLMVDTWPPPDCATFELTITAQPFDETCAGDAEFSQPPDSPLDGWTAGVSDLDWYDGFYTRYETYEVSGPVVGIRWWGLHVSLDGLASPCHEDPMQFLISFYNDDDGLPGSLVCQEAIAVSGLDTGYLYTSGARTYPLQRYQVVLNTPCLVDDGWVSIVGRGSDSNCGFWWMSSPVGDGASQAYHDGTWIPADFDLSLCLVSGDDCPGDLNGDGQRNQADLGILLAAYGVSAGGDIDGDGDTDQADLGILLSVYNIPCP